MPPPAASPVADAVAARFHARPWVDVAPGARAKVIEHQTHTFRLLELGPQFVEKDACVKSHVGYVISGRLEATLEGGGVVVLEAGDGLDLLGGAQTPHRVRALMRGTIVFLVEPRDA